MISPDMYRKRPEMGFDTLAPVADILSFADLPLVDHRVDRAGREVLRIDASVSYPRNLDPGDLLLGVLLQPNENDPNLFTMPADYVSLPHALNEAAGSSTGDRQSGLKSDELVNSIMYQLGVELGIIARILRRTPTTMDFTRIIVERTEADGSRPILLPPVEFAPIEPKKGDDVDYAMKNVARSLTTGLYEGVDTPAQRVLAKLAVDAFADGSKKALL